jgi:nicotinamide-nucleotide amidase
MKFALLGVDARLVEESGAVSEPVAEAMARGARERTGSTFSLSVTGIAGPAGGTEKTPAGTVCIGLGHPEICESRRYRFPGDRARVRAMAVQTALDLLRRKLAG